MLLLVLFTIAFALYFKSKQNASSNQEPPCHPGALPVIGHAHLIIGSSKHFWQMIKRVSKECISIGCSSTFYICGRKYYVITDPDDCLTVANACLEKDIVYRSARACFGDGLVTASTKTWKEHRKLLNPTFNVNYLLSFLGVFNKKSRTLLEEFDTKIDEGPFDHGSIIRYNGMETICLTSLGVDFSKDKDTMLEYGDAFDTIFNSLTEQVQRFWLHVQFIWQRSSLKMRRDSSRAVMYRITDTIIKKRRTDHRNNLITQNYDEGENFKPFLDVLFELKRAVGDEVMTDKIIRDHVNTLILAGHDTIAAALQFTLILIGSHPAVQDKLYAELQEVFGDSDRDVEKDDLIKLIYLEAVLKETMRVYTIVPMVARFLHQDLKLKNFTLQGGNACLLSLHGVHRHPMWGNDADQFRPERWLDLNTLPNNPNAFITFSLGKRVCIGRTYAMISMKTTLAHILRRYRISADHTKMELKLECLLKPVTGHHISIERR